MMDFPRLLEKIGQFFENVGFFRYMVLYSLFKLVLITTRWLIKIPIESILVIRLKVLG